MVKVNLKTIGKEKKSADLLSVFVQQTLATASTRQGSQVQILSHPPFILLLTKSIIIKNLMIKKFIVFTIFSLFLVSCSSTNPTNVKKTDSQKITKVDYGRVITSLPVKIKGESNWVGTTAGAMIGGLLGTQICGEKEIIGTKCQDIGVVFGTIGGAALGTVTQAMLGNHDGFQYIIDIDNSNKDSAFVQGDIEAIPDGQKVVIIYGEDVRIFPFEE